ncbi:MAG: GNAT family N-acetyltransferase [Ilumatobacteraceae bacterium]
MAIEIRTPTEDHWLELVAVDARAFGWVPNEKEIAQRRPLMDLTRFRIAVDRGRIVAVVGSFALDMTLPGRATIPASGTTWVSVSATHRRQGILTRLMAALHADADDRGEPVSALFASEGGIYRRFGYGVATTTQRVTIARAAATLSSDLAVTPGAVRYATPDEARDHHPAVWERARRERPGQVSRGAAWEEFTFVQYAESQDGMTPAFHLVHDDGYAVYRIEQGWGPIPSHTLQLVELVTDTTQARIDLWHALLGVDLVGKINSSILPPDEPLKYWLTNPRAYQVTAAYDGLWVRPNDVAIAFGARTYGTVDRLVVEVDGKRWAIESDGAEASCKAVRSKPDMVTEQGALGALLLGAVSPTELAAGRRLEARNDAALHRADAFFASRPLAHCSNHF